MKKVCHKNSDYFGFPKICSNIICSKLILLFLAAKDMLVFMLKWYEKFPDFKSRELFLTGESYAGN